MNRGVLYGIGAYTLWGLLPIYWKALQGVGASEILAHRMIWSLFFVIAVLAVQRNWGWIKPTLHNRRTLLIYTGTACILAMNWFTYIWAVNAGFIVETSLGYFINPLVNVLLGVLFLQERLRRGQLAAILIAVAGVVYLTLSYGAIPWIALTLAFTFAFYGLIRKLGPLASSEGLAVETAVLFLPAAAYLLLLQGNGAAAFANANLQTTLLLAGAGVATGLPLLLFGAAARRISLTNLGLLQYIAPTLQFLLGVLVYGEAFTRAGMVGFSLVWLALIIYISESMLHNHRKISPPILKESGQPGD